MKFKTFISGYNVPDSDRYPKLGEILKTIPIAKHWEYVSAHYEWLNDHFIQINRPGKWSIAAIERLASRYGIISGLKAEAVSFDESGGGRHIRKSII